MKEEISEKEFIEAKKVVDLYQEQQAKKKLSIYIDCTEKDLITNKYQNHRKDDCVAFWVTKFKEIPDRNPDGIIKFDSFMRLYMVESGKVFYNTYEKAYKAMIKGFKRKKLIK